MLTGRVSRELQAWVSVEILARDGQGHPVEFVLDTGFEGDLTLPPSIIRQLELSPAGHQNVLLANGSVDTLQLFAGVALWHGRRRGVEIIESGSEPLLGMGLLLGSRVTLDVRYDGAVVVDALA